MAQTVLSVLRPQSEGTVTLSYSQWEETVFQSVGLGLILNLFPEWGGWVMFWMGVILYWLFCGFL